MGDIKWIKITTNIFGDEKIRLIDAMPERDTIHYIWIRLLVQAGKTNCNGFIFLSENVPYSDEMLSTIFCRPLTSIRLALKVLKDFGMIQVNEDNLIKITNWEKHQNVEGMDRVREQNKTRVKKFREKQKQLKESNQSDDKDFKQEVERSDEAKNVKSENNNISIEEDSSSQNSNMSENDKNSNENEDKQDNYIQNSEENNDTVINNLCNATESYSNVTEDLCNVTVTEQNKRESKNKNKNQNKNSLVKRESKSNYNNTCDINKSDLSFDDGDCHYNSDLKESIQEDYCQGSDIDSSVDEKDDVTLKAIEILQYYDKITGMPGRLNLYCLKLAILLHGTEHVKMAINKALEVNKINMTYVNGILKNWRREGYPSVDDNATCGNNKKKLRFDNFEPRNYDYDSLEKSLLGWDKEE